MSDVTKTAAEYAPGSWWAAVAPQGIVVVAGDAEPDLAVRLWRVLSADADLGGLLDALTGGQHALLASLPSFAIVLREGGATRLAIRGPLAVSVATDAASLSLSGVGVTTWSEQLVPAARSVRIADPDAAASTTVFPLGDGVVRASAVEVRWDAAVPVVAPVPVVPVVPPVPPVRSAVTAPTPASVPAPTLASAPVELPEELPEAPSLPEPPRVPDLSEHGLVDSIPTVFTPLPTPGALADDPFAVDPFARTDDVDPFALADTRVVSATPDAPAAPDAPDAPDGILRPGDHDGATISIAEARALRASGVPTDTTPPPLAPPRAAAPGRLRLSTGEVVMLDRTVVIGRRPRSTRVTGTDLPRLVPVDSPQQDISRSHLELRVEGDAIIATDLQTTNGTLLNRAGTTPTRLHPGEPTVVVPGDVLDLGDEILVTIEELA